MFTNEDISLAWIITGATC